MNMNAGVIQVMRRWRSGLPLLMVVGCLFGSSPVFGQFTPPVGVQTVSCEEDYDFKLLINTQPPPSPGQGYGLHIGIGHKEGAEDTAAANVSVVTDHHCFSETDVVAGLVVPPMQTKSCLDGVGARHYYTWKSGGATDVGVFGPGVAAKEAKLASAQVRAKNTGGCPSTCRVTFTLGYFWEGNDADAEQTRPAAVPANCPPVPLVDPNEQDITTTVFWDIKCINAPAVPADGTNSAESQSMGTYYDGGWDSGLARASFDMTGVDFDPIQGSVMRFYLGTPGTGVEVAGESVTNLLIQQAHYVAPPEDFEPFLTGMGLEYYVMNEDNDVLFVTTPPFVTPAVSEWGLIVMALLLLTAGTVVLGRRRPAAA